MQKKLIAGVSSVDITPPLGLELAGYPHAPRNNTGVHDPLLATCLYLDDGKVRLALVGMDMLFFSQKHVNRVKRQIEKSLGIPCDHLVFSCSHSHSTPWASGRLDLDALVSGIAQDAEYINNLCEKLTKLVAAAQNSVFEAEIGFGTSRCGREEGVGGNRRDPVHGLCDPIVYTMPVKDSTGAIRCVMVNYAVHPTVLHADNTLCSADYVWALRARIRERFPNAEMVFGLGASGDQSTRFFRAAQSFEEAERIGFAIGDAAEQAVYSALWERSPELFVRTAVFDPMLRELPSRLKAEAHLAELREKWEELEESGAPYSERQSAHVDLFGAEDILGYVLMHESGISMEMVQDELPAALTVLECGSIRLLSLPGEVFMDVALSIREKSKCGALIINTVSNGCLPGYCYTRTDAMLGGYEVDTSLLEADAGEKLAAVAANLLTDEKQC